jgi:hypothetical protein
LSLEPELRIPIAMMEGVTFGGTSNTQPKRGYSRQAGGGDAGGMPEDNALWEMTDIRERDTNQVKLLWHYDEHPYIRQVAFLCDASVLFLSRQHNDMHVLDISGVTSKLPLPMTYVAPMGLCTSSDGKALAIVDKIGNRESKLYIYRHWGTWTVSELLSPTNLESVCMTNDCKTFISNLMWEKIVKLDQDGQQIWEKSLSGGGTHRPFLDTDENGRVVVSNPKTGLVTILNACGHVIKEFPTEYIKQPRGVCFTSRGLVMVADKEGVHDKDDRTSRRTPTVSLFTADGAYNRCVVKLEASPLHIAIYRDQYLAVATQSRGLYVYYI